MRVAILAIALLLCGCGEQGPPAPTSEESEQLNEAEEMLNAEAESAGGEAPAESD